MFRSIFDHPQGDFFFTSVTKDKIIWFVVVCQYSTATTRLGRARSNINTKHNKYNRHATTNQIILSLVTEVKRRNISLRMVKD